MSAGRRRYPIFHHAHHVAHFLFRIQQGCAPCAPGADRSIGQGRGFLRGLFLAAIQNTIVQLPGVVGLLFIGVAQQSLGRMADQLRERSIHGHPGVLAIFDVGGQGQLIDDGFQIRSDQPGRPLAGPIEWATSPAARLARLLALPVVSRLPRPSKRVRQAAA